MCVANNTGAPGIIFNVSSQVAHISVQCKYHLLFSLSPSLSPSPFLPLYPFLFLHVLNGNALTVCVYVLIHFQFQYTP